MNKVTESSAGVAGMKQGAIFKSHFFENKYYLRTANGVVCLNDGAELKLSDFLVQAEKYFPVARGLVVNIEIS